MKIDTILVVDDDPVCCFLHKVNIYKMDPSINISYCPNGEHAIDYLHTLHKRSLPFPSVILLDIHMPVLDGFGFLTQVLNTPEFPQIPVIIVSSSCAGEDLEQIKKLGDYICLCKPLSVDALYTAIHTSFHSGSYPKELNSEKVNDAAM